MFVVSCYLSLVCYVLLVSRSLFDVGCSLFAIWLLFVVGRVPLVGRRVSFVVC